MRISLAEVSKKNYEVICDLEVTEEQENYVASNTWSLVEAAYNHGYSIRAICLDEEPVGLVMWVQDSASKASIWRFMIDKDYQKKGIGRMALGLALDEIKKNPFLKEIQICYNPQNPVAKSFYSSFGFVEFGMSSDGEDMLAIISL